MIEKRFKAAVYDDNSVALIDLVDNVRLLFLKFKDKKSAVSCQGALSYQCALMNALYDESKELQKENEQLKEKLFETSKELLWATSDEVDRALYYEDEVEKLRKEIFE